MAQDAGLSRPGVIRRVDQLIKRLLAELDAAADEVAAMPAGSGTMLAAFKVSIRERANQVQSHARREGDDTPAEPAELGEAHHTYGEA